MGEWTEGVEIERRDKGLCGKLMRDIYWIRGNEGKLKS